MSNNNYYKQVALLISVIPEIAVDSRYHVCQFSSGINQGDPRTAKTNRRPTSEIRSAG